MEYRSMHSLQTFVTLVCVAIGLTGNAACEAAFAATQKKPRSASVSKKVVPIAHGNRLTDWTPSGVSALEQAPSNESTENIIVYGHRLPKTQSSPEDKDGLIALGPVTITGKTSSSFGHSNLAVTFSTSFFGVPGMDFVVNVAGGHDQRSESSTAREAAVTAGLRIAF